MVMLPKPMWPILAGLLIATVTVWAMSTDSEMGWLATIFFGTGTVILLTRYFKTGGKNRDGSKPNIRKSVYSNGHAFDPNEEGLFRFSDQGFIIKIEEEEIDIRWRDVRCMVAYRLDRFASDDIGLDIFCAGDQHFTIFEETPGWERFLESSKQALAGIDLFWEIEIAAMTPESNHTIVYDWHGRTLKEIEKEYY